jgi:hypothetical protein
LRWDKSVESPKERDEKLRQLAKSKTNLEKQLESLGHLERLRPKLSSLEYDLAHKTIRESPSTAVLKRTMSGTSLRLKTRSELMAAVIINLILDKVFVVIEEKRKTEEKHHCQHSHLSPVTRSRSQKLPSVVKWRPSDNITNCFKCSINFTWYRRKHHCRACGEVFCDTCSQLRRKIPRLNYFLPVRVCESCHMALEEEEEEEKVEKDVINFTVNMTPTVERVRSNSF